jgi:hypothetical protein
MPVPAGDWIDVESGWAAIWRIVDGSGFDPGLQPDADLRGERKKSSHAASFVSMVFQCLYRCSSRCYLQSAEPWTPMLSAWCPHRCKSTNVSRINPPVLVACDLTHVALRAAAGCRQGLMTSATASSVARIAGPRTDGPILSAAFAHPLLTAASLVPAQDVPHRLRLPAGARPPAFARNSSPCAPENSTAAPRCDSRSRRTAARIFRTPGH